MVRTLIVAAVLLLAACREDMVEKNALQRLADGYTGYLGGTTADIPATAGGGLAAALARLRETKPTTCKSHIRPGDLRAPYGDGTAEFVVTLICNERSILGLRLSVERDDVTVLGWSERVVE
jgi:hypothetical protein